VKLIDFVGQDVALLSGVNGETVRTPAHAEFRPQEVVVRGRARRSGQYLCRACNARGCSVDDNATSVDVYVRETRLPFSLVASSGAAGDRAVEGDAVGLVCSASLYDFTRKMTWHWTLPNGDVIQIDKYKAASHFLFFCFHRVLTASNVSAGTIRRPECASEPTPLSRTRMWNGSSGTASPSRPTAPTLVRSTPST